MTAELYPLILERTGGTPGGGDATGRIRRPTAQEIEAVTAAQLGWMSQQSVLGRLDGAPAAIALPAGSVLGRGATGGLRGLTSQDVDDLLTLTARLATKAAIGHGHTVADVANLQWILANTSRLGHTHPLSEIRATGITEGHVPRVRSGALVYEALPSGGGLGSPLTANLDLATWSIVCGALNVLHCSAGRVILGGARVPHLNEGTPATGHVWIWTGSAWAHRVLVQADITGTAIAGFAATSLVGQLAELLGVLNTKSAIGHSHPLTELQVPAGATPGYYLTPKAGGGWELLPLPAAGGGIANPLTANLNIAGYQIVSGANELLRFSGGQVLLGGRAVFPSTIADPQAGEVAVYDANEGDFRNRLLAASEVTVEEIPAVAGESVQAVLEDLATLVAAATLADTDDLPAGPTNKYATTSSVAAAGAVMGTDISDDETLVQERDDVVVSERAIKEYVDDSVQSLGGSLGIPQGTSFPGSPDDADLFHRLDLREMFQWSSSLSAWVGCVEHTLDHYTQRLDAGTGTGAGAYIYGTGNAAGFRAPHDLLVTSFAVQNSVADTGTVTLRVGTEGGAVSALTSLALSAQRGKVSGALSLEVDAAALLSVHASGFAVGVSFATFRVAYRRLITV